MCANRAITKMSGTSIATHMHTYTWTKVYTYTYTHTYTYIDVCK